MEKRKKLSKKELMEKYNIKSVSCGTYGEGFFDCLRGIEENNIDLFKGSHILKRIEFAKQNKLDYTWLINQLRNDWKRRTGTKGVSLLSSHD